MPEPALPPSRFGSGFTVGGPSSISPIPPTGSAPASAALDETNRLAVIAFVLVMVFGPLVAPVTLPMAHVAERQIRRSGQAGDALARGATVIGYIYLALAVVALGLLFYVGELSPVIRWWDRG